LSYPVFVRKLAEDDPAEAQDWDEAQSAGLGLASHCELGVTLARLEHSPLAGTAIYGEVRRVLLSRFPYLIWYRVDGQAVTVLACTHGKRSSATIRSKLG